MSHSGEAFTGGVETHEVEGVEVRVRGTAKTVADGLEYRSRIDLSIGIEALPDYRRSPSFDADALWHFAPVCRVSTVVRPYLQAAA